MLWKNLQFFSDGYHIIVNLVVQLKQTFTAYTYLVPASTSFDACQ